MLSNLKAVAFDIDGTMYRSWRLWLKSAPHILSHLRFFVRFAETRRELRNLDFYGDFFAGQARILAKKLKIGESEAESQIRALVYEGLRPFFEKIRECAGLRDFVVALKRKGVKLGLLSDFPPEQKGGLWNLLPFFDVKMGSEYCGSLKPAARPFLALADALGCEPCEILYIGNSVKYDVLGAKNIGMKTALIVPFWRRFLPFKNGAADISFCNYAQLQKILLSN